MKNAIREAIVMTRRRGQALRAYVGLNQDTRPRMGRIRRRAILWRYALWRR